MTKTQVVTVDQVKEAKQRRNGRGRSGRHPVLTDEQVYQVRQAFIDGLTQRQIAEKFRVTQPTVSAALSGRGAYEGL